MYMHVHLLFYNDAYRHAARIHTHTHTHTHTFVYGLAQLIRFWAEPVSGTYEL